MLNDGMIALWNDTVSPNDVVYNLGDVSVATSVAQTEAVLGKLNGEHHLILGNHDGIIKHHSDYFLTKTKHDGKPLLASVQDYLSLTIDNKTLILFHYPMSEWDGCHQGHYHLHGHIHKRLSQNKGKILNVGFDLHGRFLTLTDIDGYLQPLPNLCCFENKTDECNHEIVGSVDERSQQIALRLKLQNTT